MVSSRRQSTLCAMAAVLLLSAHVSSQPPTASVTITGDGALPMPRDWLGVNIDTGSLTNRLDLTDPFLITLTRQLNANLPPGSAATTIRVGGTASNSLEYVPNGVPGRGPGGSTILTDASLQHVLDFAAATNCKIIFGMNYQRDGTGKWNPALNATALWNRIAVAPNGSTVVGFSLGNELIGGGGFNAVQYAQDYLAFASELKKHPGVGQAVCGPSAAGFPGVAVIQPFMRTTAPALSALSFHAYAFKNCSLELYMTKTAIEHMDYYYSSYKSLRDSTAPHLPLSLEEFASQAGGGCDGLSNRFVSSYWWIHSLGLAAERNITRVTRQDLVGWSFASGVSHCECPRDFLQF